MTRKDHKMSDNKTKIIMSLNEQSYIAQMSHQIQEYIKSSLYERDFAEEDIKSALESRLVDLEDSLTPYAYSQAEEMISTHNSSIEDDLAQTHDDTTGDKYSKYTFRITETLSKDVDVEADSLEDGLKKVEDDYYNGLIEVKEIEDTRIESTLDVPHVAVENKEDDHNDKYSKYTKMVASYIQDHDSFNEQKSIKEIIGDIESYGVPVSNSSKELFNNALRHMNYECGMDYDAMFSALKEDIRIPDADIYECYVNFKPVNHDTGELLDYEPCPESSSKDNLIALHEENGVEM